MSGARREARVLGSEPLGALELVRLELADGGGPGGPGTFHMAHDPDGATFLPRSIGLVPLRDGGTAMVVAPGTSAGRLARARSLVLLGPLGTGYDPAGLAADEVLLVGEGFGVAAFAGAPALLGGRPRLLAVGDPGLAALVDAELEAVADADAAAARVAELLAPGTLRAVWVAAGRATAAVAAAAAAAGVACRVALHAPMACGFGACFGCVVRLDGAWKRACVEGPVVDAARLGEPA